MLDFICNLLCERSDTERLIDELQEGFGIENNIIINNYLERIQYEYNLFKYKRKLFKALRFLQFIGGFGITTMTTYNNPYFKDNTDTINILVWYFSISNNIFNILIEMLNAYDLTTEKMRIKLLIREGILFISNHRDYNYYPVEVDNNEKLQYFSRACNEIINNTPFDYLTSNVSHENDLINESRRRRLSRVWGDPVPTPDHECIECIEDTEDTEDTECTEDKCECV